MNHSTHSKTAYRLEIDGLRAFAVLSVVFFHAFPNQLHGGFIGVDVFFVISGFLITTHIFEQLANGRFSFFDFFGRRIRRIFPALIPVMTFSLIFGWFVLWAEEFAQLGKHVASGAAFITNFILVHESGYFDNAAETKPMLHLWSLAVEEQFYIIWPVILWFAWHRQLNLLTVTLFFAFISFWLNLSLVESHPTEIFFWPIGRFWELLSGSILAWLLLYKSETFNQSKLKLYYCIVKLLRFKNVRRRDAAVSNLMAFIGFLLLAYGIIHINEDLLFPSEWALIPVLGTLLIIGGGQQAWLNRFFLMNPIAVWFGLISYPLYLWHWPILSFLQIIDGELPHRDARFAAVLVSILLAWATYKYIEKPIRSKELSIQRAFFLSLPMILLGCVGFYLSLHGGAPERSFVIQNEKINSEFVGPIWEYANNESCKNRFGIQGSEEWGWSFCIINNESPPSVILLGNSYANHLYPGFVNNERLNHHTTLSVGACDVEWIDYDAKLEQEKKTRTSNSPCWGKREIEQFENINRIIETQKTLEYAILVLKDVKNIDELRYTNLLKRIKLIERSGIQVILFQPHSNPKQLYDTRSCYSRPISKPKNDCVINTDDLFSENSAFKKLIEKLKYETDVLGFNPNELFCNDKHECSYILDDQMPAFRDKYAHLSLYASKKLFEKHFVTWAEKNVPSILK